MTDFRNTRDRYMNLFTLCLYNVDNEFLREDAKKIVDKFKENNNFFNYIEYILTNLNKYKTRIYQGSDIHSTRTNIKIIIFAVLLYIEAVEAKCQKLYRFNDNFIDCILFDRETNKYMVKIDVREFIFPLGLTLQDINLSHLFNGRSYEFITYIEQNKSHSNDDRESGKKRLRTEVDDSLIQRPLEIPTQRPIERPVESTRYQQDPRLQQRPDIPVRDPRINHQTHHYVDRKSYQEIENEELKKKIRYLEWQLNEASQHIKSLERERDDMRKVLYRPSY